MTELLLLYRYLATGDSFRSVAFCFRVGASTAAGIVNEVCQAIWNSLLADYMPRPDAAEWRKIAAEFSHLDFPNCLGAMDGKHVVIEAPPSSGSLYYNYKGTFSIVLLAVVDAKYRFRVVDIGAYGRNSDGGTLSASAFGTALRQNTLGIPADSPLPGAEHLTQTFHNVLFSLMQLDNLCNLNIPHVSARCLSLQVTEVLTALEDNLKTRPLTPCHSPYSPSCLQLNY